MSMSDSSLGITSYHSWASTLFSNHQLPLLVVATQLVASGDKPHLDAVACILEHHMRLVALPWEDAAGYRRVLGTH